MAVPWGTEPALPHSPSSLSSASATLRPTLVAVALAVAVHALLVSPFRLNFLADDYNLLATAHEPGGLAIGSFGAYWSRVPVWSLITWTVFRSGVWERTWLPMHLFFAAHAAAIAVLLRWWLRRTGVALSIGRFAAIVAVVSLQPNSYEVLYWPTDMAYTVGALLLALGVTARRTLTAAIALALSFLTLETFVLPALAFAVLDALVDRWTGSPARASTGAADGGEPRQSWWGRGATPSLRAWLLAMILYAAVRLGLATAVQYPYHVALAPAGVLGNLAEAAGGLFLIHFRRPQWPASVLQVAILGAIAIGLVRRRQLRWSTLAIVALACFASTGAYWILAYSAPRALYGSGLLFAVMAGWLLRLAFRAAPRPAVAFAALALLAGVYVTQDLRIFSIKHHNARTLAARESELAAAMRACAAPCTLTVAALDRDLRPDWVLPRPYWEPYLRWVRARHAPEKSITFRILKPEAAVE